MNTPILEVSDIQKYYGNKGNITKAVNRISLSVGKGEFVGIMGASGSGKTTLLNCISTIDTVTSGKILVEGKDITTLRGKQLSAFRREKLGFIFQDFNLLDTLTAYENISLALSISGIKAKEIDKRVQEIARALNITEVLEKYPYQMSGGQQQRVAAARAMATILMVTHDSFTASYCRRILFIKDGKIFNEIHRGAKSRKEFFEEIMEVVSVLGGETNDRG